MSDDDRVFFESTRRLAPPSLAREDVRAALELLRPALGAAGRVADLGCGYGRHLAALQGQGVPHPIGVDKSALLLREARKLAPAARLIRADLRSLPIREGSLDAAACFYSSMFLGTDEGARAALAEVRRALKPSGLLVLTTDNPLRLADSPRSSFRDDVPGLGRVTEESHFDGTTDTVRRRIEQGVPGGTAAPRGALEAEFRIRYYRPEELSKLADAAGLKLLRLEPDAPLTASTPQLIALLGRRS